jgi:hypothetical protein
MHWTAASFVALKQLITEEVPEQPTVEVSEGGAKRTEMARIEHSLDPTNALEGEDEMATKWAAREREAPAPEAYRKSLAKQWRAVGCAAEGTTHVHSKRSPPKPVRATYRTGRNLDDCVAPALNSPRRSARAEKALGKQKPLPTPMSANEHSPRSKPCTR